MNTSRPGAREQRRQASIARAVVDHYNRGFVRRNVDWLIEVTQSAPLTVVGTAALTGLVVSLLLPRRA